MHFNKNIYSESAIKKAIKAFSRLSACSLKKSGNYYEVRAAGATPELMNEFSNYVLAESVQS